VLTGSKIDVKVLQADPRNDDAVFQVASNFHAIEGVVDYYGDNRSLNSWQFINTQGEHASMSAFPGAVYRKYLLDGPIDLLEDVVASGLVQTTQDGRVRYIASCRELNEQCGRIKIGYHSDISVTHGAHYENIVARHQKVNQVFLLQRSIWVSVTTLL
jgi:hypothetical protein